MEARATSRQTCVLIRTLEDLGERMEAEAAGDTRALTRAHNMLGGVAAEVGDLATARRHLVESLALVGDLGDQDARVAALNNLALVHGTGGGTDRTIELTGEASALCASVGDRHREAALRNNLVDLLHAAGERRSPWSTQKRPSPSSPRSGKTARCSPRSGNSPNAEPLRGPRVGR